MDRGEGLVPSLVLGGLRRVEHGALAGVGGSFGPGAAAAVVDDLVGLVDDPGEVARRHVAGAADLLGPRIPDRGGIKHDVRTGVLSVVDESFPVGAAGISGEEALRDQLLRKGQGAAAGLAARERAVAPPLAPIS